MALTDLILCLEALFLAFLLYRERNHHSLRYASLLFFISFALSSFLGVIVHGFFPTPDSIWNAIFWTVTLLAVGLISFFSWIIVIDLLVPQYRKVLVAMACLEFLGYSLYILFIDHPFKVAIYNYVPSTLFLLIAFGFLYVRGKKSALFGFFGLLLSLIASWIQQAKIAIHPIYFNHNALYHVLEAIALFLVFLTLRDLLRKQLP